jgi:hypothetical protein
VTAQRRQSIRGAGLHALLLHGEERFLVDERARTTIDEWRQ